MSSNTFNTHNTKKKSYIRDFCNLLISCTLCSIAVNWIAIKNGFVATGTTGLALSIEKIIHINYSLIYYFITLIVLLITRIKLGAKEAHKIIFLSILFPITLYILNCIPINFSIENKLVAIIIYGILCGVGTGFAYITGYTFGGTDSITKLLKHTIFKNLSLKLILSIVEGCILLFMMLVFDISTVFYSFIGQIVFVCFYNIIITSKDKNNNKSNNIK